MTDYADMAIGMVRAADSVRYDDSLRSAALVEAQVYAVLALVEEQRTANLIAYATSGQVTPDRGRALMTQAAQRMEMDR